MRVGISQARDVASWRETSLSPKGALCSKHVSLNGAVVAHEGNGSLKESEAQVHGLLSPSLDCALQGAGSRKVGCSY